MNSYFLFAIIISYLAILFFIAFLAEKNTKSRWVNNPYIYTLSLAVYCSAWTYYGSIGVATNKGLDFLPIYLGPIIAIPLWIVIMRKIIRISNIYKISSIADLISLRYGNNRFLGALITLICIIATIPYIALQIKAISESFQILTNTTNTAQNWVNDYTFYIIFILALFAAFYGTQKSDATLKHKGIIAASAFESIIKLFFFLIIGLYVTYYLFDGTEDIYNRMSKTPNFKQLITFNGIESGFNWLFMIMLSFMAIFLLPRQFQVAVVENTRERHLKKAIWLFPLYLLLFNLFVIFIAWGGFLTFGNTVNAEYYTLYLPLKNNHTFLALLVFLGGFSAIISMIIVSTLALSIMISNNLIIPYGFLTKFSKGSSQKNENYIKNIRRISILLIILSAYLFYINFSFQLSLFSIGLISFVIIAQLGPSFFIGLFWNRGSSKAAITGMIIGFLITFYTLILPFTIESIAGSDDFTQNGLFNINSLKPYALFGIDFLSPPAHAFFWSLFFNTFTYLILSLLFKSNYRERNYAEMFVDSSNLSKLQDSALVWKGEAYVADIKRILIKMLGVKRTERALNLFFLKYKLPKDTQMADARLINFSEKLLTGIIGNASAKILISSAVKEEEISLKEVLKILEESKESHVTNKLLKDKSYQLTKLTKQLKNVNVELTEKDKQKDEFLDTVAHEIKTPITGIKAATELLIEDINTMPEAIKNQFLKNILQDSNRLSRLIHNLLDFEKLSNNRLELNLQKNNINLTISKTIQSLNQIASKKNIRIIFDEKLIPKFKYDEDRIIQVLTNIISNAIKFCPEKNGIIQIISKLNVNTVIVEITDNGKGVPKEDQEFVFNKFYQSKHQNTKKPIGSGLGLAISKKIVDTHNGKIYIKNAKKTGTTFVFNLPFI